MLRDLAQHFAAELVAVVERKLAVRPALATEQPVRSFLSFDTPADSQDRGQHSRRFTRRPVAHSRWKRKH